MKQPQPMVDFNLCHLQRVVKIIHEFTHSNFSVSCIVIVQLVIENSYCPRYYCILHVIIDQCVIYFHKDIANEEKRNWAWQYPTVTKRANSFDNRVHSTIVNYNYRTLADLEDRCLAVFDRAEGG